MNKMAGWPIPILTTCLVHGAIIMLPINFGKKNDQLHGTAVTIRLVSLPQIAPLPAMEQSVFPPKKKPSPPQEVYQDKATSTPPRPVAQSQNKAKDNTELQQSVITQETPMALSVAVMQAKGASSTQASFGTSSGSVMLASELSVICPVTNAPSYPRQSRRLGEAGELTLKLELDESGRVKEAQVINSSGYRRLDEAALAAVKTWRCNPPLHNGQPVRAIALQPFSFVLQE